MARSFIIPGGTMVFVKGGAHYGDQPISRRSELGLTSEEIRITPTFFHRDYFVDDFGQNEAPPEVAWGTAVVDLPMTLIHYDPLVLECCTAESMAGGKFVDLGGVAGRGQAGTFPPAGKPMGGGSPVFSSGNHLISVNLISTNLEPWRFLACYLTKTPFVYPLGTTAAAVELNWRCIPYQPLATSVALGASGSISLVGEVLSSGAVLWDYVEDE